MMMMMVCVLMMMMMWWSRGCRWTKWRRSNWWRAPGRTHKLSFPSLFDDDVGGGGDDDCENTIFYLLQFLFAPCTFKLWWWWQLIGGWAFKWPSHGRDDGSFWSHVCKKKTMLASQAHGGKYKYKFLQYRYTTSKRNRNSYIKVKFS